MESKWETESLDERCCVEMIYQGLLSFLGSGPGLVRASVRSGSGISKNPVKRVIIADNIKDYVTMLCNNNASLYL